MELTGAGGGRCRLTLLKPLRACARWPLLLAPAGYRKEADDSAEGLV